MRNNPRRIDPYAHAHRFDEEEQDLDFDDEEYDAWLFTSLTSMEAEIEAVLGKSAPVFMLLVLLAAAGLGSRPVSMRISSSNDFAIQQFIRASHLLSKGLLMGGPMFDGELNTDAPVRVEVLLEEQCPESMAPVPIEDAPSRLFLQVCDNPPTPVKGVLDVWLDASEAHSRYLKGWIDGRKKRVKAELPIEEVPCNLVKGFINMGMAGLSPAQNSDLDVHRVSATSGTSDETADLIECLLLAAFYMTGTVGVTSFYAREMILFQQVASLLVRAGAFKP